MQRNCIVFTLVPVAIAVAAFAAYSFAASVTFMAQETRVLGVESMNRK